jgi:polyferredoxin
MSPASYQTAPPRDVFCCNLTALSVLTALTALSRRAGNGTRTRDPNLGKVVLYQLSYSRGAVRILAPVPPRRNDPN